MYPYYPTYPQSPYYGAAQQSGGLIWVQGIEGAKSHAVSAGQSVLLMDSESNCFFIKSADASGMPMPLRVFDYTERVQSVQKQPIAAGLDISGFITRDEFEARIAQICAVKKEGANDAE